MTNPRLSAIAAALSCASAICAGAPAPAATPLFNDFGPGESYTFAGGTGVQAPSWAPAASFVSAASGSVRQIDLALLLGYGPSRVDTAIVSLWTDVSGGLGVELGSWEVPKVDYEPLNSTGHLAQIHGITGVSLTAGQTYFLQATTTSHDFIDAWFQNSVGAVSANYLFDGVTYANVPTPAFDVMAAVPEPAAWTLMLIGFGGLGLLARRRRAAVVGG